MSKARKVTVIVTVIAVVLASVAGFAVVKYQDWTKQPEQVYTRHVKEHADVGGNTSKTLIGGGRSVCAMFESGKTEADVDKAMEFEDFPEDLAAATKLYAVLDLCPQFTSKLAKTS